MNRGVLYALTAWVWWGLFPLYIRALRQIAPLEILAHRTLGALLFMAALLLATRRAGALWRQLSRQALLRFAVSALLIATNWGVYIWTVDQHRVIHASLGYYINPLVSVLLGALVLRERLRPGQWLAVAVAALGVVQFAGAIGSLPLDSLVLALSFGLYGVMRKIAPFGAVDGLAIETVLLAPVALVYLGWLIATGQSGLAQADGGTIALLALAGPMTAIPLIAFAAAARRIPLAMLGFMQYLSPTLQWILGLWLFHEPFNQAQALGFAIIWAALLLFTAESWRFRGQAPQT